VNGTTEADYIVRHSWDLPSNWNLSWCNATYTPAICPVNISMNACMENSDLNSNCTETWGFSFAPMGNLSLTTTGNGTAITNQTDFYVPATFSINATPNTNWTFTNWTVTEGTCTIGNYTNANTNTTINVSENCTINALFTDNPRANLTVNYTIGGTATGNQTNFYIPATFPINATSSTIYTFVNWTVTNGTCVIGNSSSPNTNVTINESETCNVQANFKIGIVSGGGGGAAITNVLYQYALTMELRDKPLYGKITVGIVLIMIPLFMFLIMLLYLDEKRYGFAATAVKTLSLASVAIMIWWMGYI